MEREYIVLNSFKCPLFNEVMENELIKVISSEEMQKNKFPAINTASKIIHEVINENENVGKVIDFNTVYNQERCNKVCNRYKDYDPKIETLEFEICVKSGFMMPDKSSEFLIIHRDFLKANAVSKNRDYLFLHRLFLDLYSAYIYCEEKTI